MPPLVTIITPVYNRGSFLNETISSVVNQDYPHIEYLLLDDGSTDNGLAIIEEWAAKCPMIKFDTHANMGETRTVNKGFSMAGGEIIGVVNSDDPLLPGAIRSIVDVMSKRTEVIVAYPDWDMIDANGQKIVHIDTYEYDYTNMLRWHHCLPGPGTLFRKSVVDRLNGRDTQFRYVADFDFWLRAGTLGLFCRVPQTLATFRLHQGGATLNDQGPVMAEEHLTLVTKILSMPGLPPLTPAVRREAIGSAYYIAGCALGDTLPQVRKRYFAQAFRSAPAKYLHEYRERLIGPIAPLLFGRHAANLLRIAHTLIPAKRNFRCPH